MKNCWDWASCSCLNVHLPAPSAWICISLNWNISCDKRPRVENNDASISSKLSPHPIKSPILIVIIHTINLSCSESFCTSMQPPKSHLPPSPPAKYHSIALPLNYSPAYHLPPISFSCGSYWCYYDVRFQITWSTLKIWMFLQFILQAVKSEIHSSLPLLLVKFQTLWNQLPYFYFLQKL